MSEHRDALINDVLIEGRDQEKSHVLLEIARPTPAERATHGYFFAVVELSGATPKTVHMVQAWVDFAIERYYQAVPHDVATHFEDILHKLNTQSGMYLKQHANEHVAMALCVVHDTITHVAIHGSPTVLLLYHASAGWRALNLAAQAEQSGQLFSNVLTGSLRPDDRLLIASTHVADFFSADRLSKISEGKSVPEVSEHMSRVLGDLSSDVSFGYVWVRVARVLSENDTDTSAALTKQPGKKSGASMADLLLRTKSTASILAPSVISLPKDKIVTTILQGTSRGARIGWQWTRVLTQRSFVAARQSRVMQRAVGALHPRSLWDQARKLIFHVSRQFNELPARRKKILIIASISVAVIFAAILGLLWQQYSLNRTAQATSLTAKFRDSMRTTEDTFMSQRDAEARLLLADAQQQFRTLEQEDLLDNQEREKLRGLLAGLTQKVLREQRLKIVAHQTTGRAIAVASLNTVVAVLTDNGAVSIVRNGVLTALATVPRGVNLFADKNRERFIVVTDDGALVGVHVQTGATTPITLNRITEHTVTAAHVFYNGRYYAYDTVAKQIFRYENKQPMSYDNGKRWITDGGQPMDVVSLSADSSLWLVTGKGAPLKYTAGKLQPYRVSGVEPALERARGVAVGPKSNNLYVIDADRPRIVVTDRDGVLQQQLTFPSNISGIAAIAVDEKESTVSVITPDGRFFTASHEII